MKEREREEGSEARRKRDNARKKRVREKEDLQEKDALCSGGV